MSAVVMAVAIQVAEGQVAEGVYPDGEIKYRCASRGYTAWWQRKTYFTFLTAYILVVPASVDDDTTSSAREQGDLVNFDNIGKRGCSTRYRPIPQIYCFCRRYGNRCTRLGENARP